MRRQEGGITTGVAIHNLESSPGLVRCELMRKGVLRDSASIPLEANGQTAWLNRDAFHSRELALDRPKREAMLERAVARQPEQQQERTRDPGPTKDYGPSR